MAKAKKPNCGGNHQDDESDSKATKPKSGKKIPLWLYEPHKSCSICHLLCDCRDCPETEKPALRKAHAGEKANTGPSRSTRGQLQKISPTENNNKTVQRLEGQSQAKSTCVHSVTTSSYLVTFTDGTESMNANGCTDDGSNKSIVSPRFAERAVLNGMGQMTKMDKVTLQVALKNTTEAQSFK